ncbi:unnamed protein product [Clonostachys chloroleuca]|uniref:F-box domain-containing protein n=1 Tax=Clonostachys chloroleuca TaxID=1926264 RepID=A0AA35LRW5_9HYPO|nr:unnamed protein product [Clonostachys chloroleuca]
MESTCALCGVCICWESPERWLREFRAVYTHNRNWSDIKLSGVGIATEESFTAICPEDSDRKHDDEDLADDDTLYIGLGSANLRTRSTSGLQPLEFTGFGIHSACWNLLTRLFQPDLQLLFHACLSMPIGPRDTVDWGHNYDGAAFYSKGPVPEINSYDPGTLARHEDAAIFRSDPFDIPSLHRVLKSIYQLESLLPPLDPPENRSDIFNSLPTEILHFIITSLPSTDVKHLREASRTFATLDLPEMFWASRFGRGHEFHYVFESLENHPKSWKALYIMLRMLDLSFPALQNRRRVWSLALRLQSLHDQMAGILCQGQSRATLFEPDSVSNEDQQHWSTAGRAVRPPTTTPFYFGCLPLRSRQVTWVSPLRIAHLMVSFISINDTKYISGLRFIKEQGGDDSLGYIHPATEEPICLPQPAEVREWCFGVDLRGIKAISLKTESGWNSPWYSLPFTTCFFGPAENPEPSTLIQVVAHTYDMFTLAGLEFIHTDGSKNILLGRRGPFDNMPGNRVYENSEDRHLPFSIDGPSGERITGIQVEKSWGDVRGIQFETNHDRVIGYGPESSSRNKENWITVKPCGSLVVGIFAQCGATLKNFGLLSVDEIDQMVER